MTERDPTEQVNVERGMDAAARDKLTRAVRFMRMSFWLWTFAAVMSAAAFVTSVVDGDMPIALLSGTLLTIGTLRAFSRAGSLRSARGLHATGA